MFRTWLTPILAGAVGLVMLTVGCRAENEAELRQAIEINERALGKDAPETLASISKLAAFYWVLTRHDEAETLYKHVIEVNERVFGKEHPSTLESSTAWGSFMNSLAGPAKPMRFTSAPWKRACACSAGSTPIRFHAPFG